MNRTIIKSVNNLGEKCKTYVYVFENSIIFHKYTLVKDLEFMNMVGGETVIKKTDNYKLSFHRFSLKKDTLFQAISKLL